MKNIERIYSAIAMAIKKIALTCSVCHFHWILHVFIGLTDVLLCYRWKSSLRLANWIKKWNYNAVEGWLLFNTLDNGILLIGFVVVVAGADALLLLACWMHIARENLSVCRLIVWFDIWCSRTHESNGYEN